MRFTSSRAEHALRVHLKNDDAAITRLAGQASRSKNPSSRWEVGGWNGTGVYPAASRSRGQENSQLARTSQLVTPTSIVSPFFLSHCLYPRMIGWSGTFKSWHKANRHVLISGVSVGRRNLCCLIRPGERVAERRGCLVPKIRDPCNLAAASAVAGTHCMPYGLYPVTKAMLSSGRWQLCSPTPLQRHNPNEFNGQHDNLCQGSRGRRFCLPSWRICFLLTPLALDIAYILVGVLRIGSPSVGVSHAGARISLTLENPEILSYTRSPTPH
ncbi:hypothetical protein CTAM01_16270 [Colletotrichum tamarilloi]|uniref:Uncharacterized protein n=1 Tax=Colletotrichum tamarilloi TaxID=1209934 RepID=A0ABQ9QJ12_9PEZI|nr:uncharacterized protein CTAM01_16270 [Colletotrichum tamarilloi]KAK1472811.1 hypothetical protein CTAM01_16270 [Colletotrichum tamarilloi]